MLNVRSIVAVGIALLSAAANLASDWPQFRGPHRDGTWDETGVLERFPAEGIKIEWKHPVGGGWASPVIADGRVFLFDAELVKPKSRERLHCFDQKTGKVLWQFIYEEPYGDWAYVPERGAGPTATPIIEGERIYIVGADGWTHCLDCKTGKLIWENRLAKQYDISEMQARPSPLIEGDLLITSTGARPGASVIALDKNTGKEIWKASDDPVSNSSPIVISKQGKRQLIVWSNASLTSFDPATGKLFWREAMTTSGNDSAATPLFQNGKLLVSGLMVEVSFDPPEAKILWPQERAPSKRLLSNTSTAVFRGDYIYSARGQGELVCLQAATGKEIWTTNSVTALKNGGSIHITQQAGGYLLFTDEGNLIRAELSPAGYREISRSRLINPVYEFGGHKLVWAVPAFANRHVFARTEGEIVCGSLESPK